MCSKPKDVNMALENDGVLSDSYTKLTITNTDTNEDILIISHGDTPVDILDGKYIVRLTPKYG